MVTLYTQDGNSKKRVRKKSHAFLYICLATRRCGRKREIKDYVEMLFLERHEQIPGMAQRVPQRNASTQL